MSEETNIIKSISTHKCPHCDKEIFVESHMTPTTVNSVFTEEDIKKAKQDCIARVETLSIEDDQKEAVKKWLSDPDIIFGATEVDSIILSLLKPKE